MDSKFTFDENCADLFIGKLLADLQSSLKVLGTEFSSGLDNGLMPKDLLGFQPSQIEAMYEKANLFFSAGQYEKAREELKVLSLVDPLNPKFTFALAACLHRQKKYELACASYALASTQNPKDPTPYLHAADCQLKMENKGLAQKLLKTCLSLCGEGPTFADVKREALFVWQTNFKAVSK